MFLLISIQSESYRLAQEQALSRLGMPGSYLSVAQQINKKPKVFHEKKETTIVDLNVEDNAQIQMRV